MDASTLVARLEAATASFRNLERQLADPDVAADPTRLEKIARERARLEPLVLGFEELQGLEDEQQQTRELLKESRGDAAMEELAQEDLASLNSRHAELTETLTVALLPRDPRDERSVMLEIRAGLVAMKPASGLGSGACTRPQPAGLERTTHQQQ